MSGPIRLLYMYIVEWTNQIAAGVGADLVWCVWVGPVSSWKVGGASVDPGVTFGREGVWLVGCVCVQSSLTSEGVYEWGEEKRIWRRRI